VCRFQNGGTPSKSIERYFTGDIPWITGADLIGPIALQARSFITEEAIASSATNQVPAGTVLLVTRTSVGKVAIAGMSLCFSQDITALTPDAKRLSAEYLVHFLRTKQEHFTKHARGATIQGITREVVADLEIPLPPLEEQRRIAAILDQAETLRTQRRQALAHLDTLTQSLFLDMFGDPVVNPKGWPLGTLKSLGKVSTGGTPPSNLQGMFHGAIPFLTPGDLESESLVKRTVTEAGAAEAVAVRAGATLVCCIGATIGKTDIARQRSAFNQQLNAVDWNSSIDDCYGLMALRALKPIIVSRGASTTMPILKKSSFEQLSICVPPLALQQTFATRIQAIDALKAAHRTALAQLDALFASLQQRAFTGVL
jgi:type I restriction enzyme S subunit